MSWKITDLDKDKTIACIQNEQQRIEECRKMLLCLESEYEKKRLKYTEELFDLENKIEKMGKVIENGNNFINGCKEHLKSF